MASLPGAASPARPRRAILLLIFSAICIYVGANYYYISRQAELDETRPADAIVVFGAAEYSGKPSPVLRARLEHAVELYRNGVAPFVITTGGNGEDPNFSEGGVGREYMTASGIPESHVIAETQSDDTSESAQRVAAIMKVNHMQTCLVVSDGYHIYRIKKMMAKQGITAYGAPRPGTKNLKESHRALLFLREVLSLTLWRLHIT